MQYSPDLVEQVVLLRDQREKTFASIAEELGLSDRTIRRIYQSTRSPSIADEHAEDQHLLEGATKRPIKSIEDLMNFLGIDSSMFALESVDVGSWGVKCAGEDPETLYKVKAKVSPLPIVSTGDLGLKTPTDLPPLQQPHGGLRCLVAIPDTQHGFRDGVPLHDDDFLESVLNVIGFLREQGTLAHVALCGDHLDLAPWSKYRVTPDLQQTTNASLKALHTFLVRLRETAACPIDWFEGNHEKRIMDFLADKAPEAWSLKDPVTGKRVFSLENLMHLDDLDIKYVAPYGTRKWYFDNKLYGYHGTKHGGKLGQVFEQHLAEGAASAFFGHTHNQGIVKKTLDLPGRPEHSAISPGCGCKSNGIVPSGLDVPRSWQMGLAVMWYDGERIYPELLSYQNGRIVWAGRSF